MLNLKMKINKKLLPIKGHFFFFNAGTAPLVPYLSTYARQLGFSSATVGLIYTVLPIFGLIAKPLFGIIADRFKQQKSIFILFQIVTIVSFSAIYVIPESRPTVSVNLDCGDSVTELRSCYKKAELIDECKINSLGNQNTTATCSMNCDMSTPKMWQTICEHWHIPQYCYSNTKNIQFTSFLSNITVNKNDSCAYVATNNMTLDGLTYVPHCGMGYDYVDINEPCSLNCTNPNLSKTVGTEKPLLTCVDNMLNYKFCTKEEAQLQELTKETQLEQCNASCDLDESTPWRLMEICDGLSADDSSSCQPKTKMGEDFPSNLSFIGKILLSTTLAEHNCVYIRLNHIELPDGSTHYPNCIPQEGLFQTSCEITCDNAEVNEVFAAATESFNTETTQYTKQFWLFFMLMIISWVGQAVVVTFADAICFNLLGDKIAHYGKQRLWGSVGWGIFSLLTGVLIDTFSDGAYKDYTIAFILMFVFMSGDVVVSCFLKNDSTKMSLNILADIGTLLSSLPTIIFMLWTIAVGICTGLLWQFLFWHLEDVAAATCDGSNYIKTLQGLVSAIQTFGGEIPFLFVSGYILKKMGHVNMMTLVLLAFGVRFILYSLLTNAWWVLPIELFQGITFGMFYPTMTSYANVLSPPGTETTVQGLVGAIFEGVGTSLGSFIGGRLYETYGGRNTFQWFGIGSLVCCGVHVVVQYVVRNRPGHVGFRQGYTSVIKYEQPNDMVYILEDITEVSDR